MTHGFRAFQARSSCTGHSAGVEWIDRSGPAATLELQHPNPVFKANAASSRRSQAGAWAHCWRTRMRFRTPAAISASVMSAKKRLSTRRIFRVSGRQLQHGVEGGHVLSRCSRARRRVESFPGSAQRARQTMARCIASCACCRGPATASGRQLPALGESLQGRDPPLGREFTRSMGWVGSRISWAMQTPHAARARAPRGLHGHLVTPNGTESIY